MDKTRERIRLITQAKFGEIAGCDYSTASRLEHGARLPGPDLLGRIVERFQLNQGEAFAAYTNGREAFGDFLRRNVFFSYPEEEKGS